MSTHGLLSISTQAQGMGTNLLRTYSWYDPKAMNIVSEDMHGAVIETTTNCSFEEWHWGVHHTSNGVLWYEYPSGYHVRESMTYRWLYLVQSARCKVGQQREANTHKSEWECLCDTKSSVNTHLSRNLSIRDSTVGFSTHVESSRRVEFPIVIVNIR